MSDKELEQLIKSVEEEGLLQAPHYLKDNLLSRIELEEHNIETTCQVTTFSTKPSRSKNIQLTLYSMKVALAAAAAIALIMLIPIADGEIPLDKQNAYEQQMEYEQMQKNLPTDYEEEANQVQSTNKSIYKTTNSLCSKLLEKTNEIFK